MNPTTITRSIITAATLICMSLCGFAQDEKMTLIRGRFATEHPPEEVSLNAVKNGAPVLHSKAKVAKDGSFGFYFQPETKGLYTVGERGTAARLYLTQGRSVQLTVEEAGFTVNAEDRENKLLADWSKKIWELKKCNQLKGIYTYVEVFPTLPELEKVTNETVLKAKSGNAEFDALFAKLVPAEFEYEVFHFLIMPRTKHPKPEDYPKIYKRISTEPRFTDDSVLSFDFGMNYVYAYLMFQHTAHREELAKSDDPMAATCLQYMPNDTLKGWFIATNVLTRARAYDDAFIAKLEKYRKYLVTEEQRKVVADFVLTINKTAAGEPAQPFEGETPDGKTVQLSDFKGKVVLVDIWATWCGPCRAQIPALKKLEEEMKDQDVAFISYSVDEPKDHDKWKKMVAAEKLGSVQLIGPAAFKSPVCTNYKITAIPRFMVFDKKGNIVSIDAPRPSTPQLKELIEKHLK